MNTQPFGRLMNVSASSLGLCMTGRLYPCRDATSEQEQEGFPAYKIPHASVIDIP